MKKNKNKQNKGYQVIKTLSAGTNSTYTFKKDGRQSILGFDHAQDVKDYIIERENGNRHFMDKID